MQGRQAAGFMLFHSQYHVELGMAAKATVFTLERI
jgi:hypothetical protein